MNEGGLYSIEADFQFKNNNIITSVIELIRRLHEIRKIQIRISTEVIFSHKLYTPFYYNVDIYYRDIKLLANLICDIIYSSFSLSVFQAHLLELKIVKIYTKILVTKIRLNRLWPSHL